MFQVNQLLPHQQRGVEMKRETLFGIVLFGLLTCVLLITATHPLIFAQDKTPNPDTKPKLALGVLIDASPHQKKVIEFEREVVSSIAERFDGLAAESFVISYAGKVNLLQDWSPLETGLEKASTQTDLEVEDGKNGRTLLNDALKAALLKLGARNDSDSKALIVIGEGNDLGSTAKYSQIKKLAKSSHVQCFALLVASHDLIGGRVRHFGFDLYDLADATKGHAYDVYTSRKHSDKAVKDILKRIEKFASRYPPPDNQSVLNKPSGFGTAYSEVTPAKPESLEIGSVGQKNTVARVAVAGHLNEGYGELLRLDIEFFAQRFCDAFRRAAFLLGGAPCQHRDLHMRHATPPPDSAQALGPRGLRLRPLARISFLTSKSETFYAKSPR